MPDHFFVYPSYLDRAASRRLGRRVPAAVAVEEPTVEAIAAAAQRLGYAVEVESAKQYPRRFDPPTGRVRLVKKAGEAKARTLRAIAAAMGAPA